MIGVVEARELPEVLDRRLQRGDVQRRGLQYGGCAGVRIEIGAARPTGTLELRAKSKVVSLILQVGDIRAVLSSQRQPSVNADQP